MFRHRAHSYTMQALAGAGGGGGIPTRGLVYWHPLAESLGVLPTGQSVTQSGAWTYGTVGGVPCATKGNGNASILCTDGAGIPVGSAARTLSVWIRPSTANRSIVVCGWGGGGDTNAWRFAIRNNTITMPTLGRNATEVAANAWHHYAATLKNGHVDWYMDGSHAGGEDYTVSTVEVSASNPVYISTASYQYAFAAASVRIYDRSLKTSEIAALAAEHTPTS